MIDERLASEIRDAFENRHSPSPGLEHRVMSAIPWDRPADRAASVPRLAVAFTAVLTVFVVAVLLAPSVLTMGSRLVRTSPSRSPSGLVNTFPQCKGIRLLPERTYERIAVYRWRSSGSTYVAVPTGLDGSLAIDSTFMPPTQPDDRGLYVVVYFDAKGKALLSQLTSEIAATGSDTPDHHMPVLVGLSDQQVANWSDPTVAKKALMPVEQGGNLLSNGLVLMAFAGNQLIVYFGPDMPTACSLTARMR